MHFGCNIGKVFATIGAGKFSKPFNRKPEETAEEVVG